MGTMTLICSQCGGTMTVNGGNEALCSHCGAVTLIKDDIVQHNHQTTQIITKNIFGSEMPDAADLISNGKVLLDLGEYSMALEAYEKASGLNPADHRAWDGQLRCVSKNLTVPADYSGYMEKARRTAPPEAKDSLEKDYKKYEQFIKEHDKRRSLEFDRIMGVLPLPKFGAGELESKRASFASNPKNKLTVQNGVLLRCKSSEEIIFLPAGIREIAPEAFSFWFHYTRAKWIILPDGLETIRSRAFSGAVELCGIEIPKSVRSIEDEAFINCRKLRKVHYRGIPKLGSRIFDSPAMSFSYPEDE